VSVQINEVALFPSKKRAKRSQGTPDIGGPRKNTYYIYEKANLTIVLSPTPRQAQKFKNSFVPEQFIFLYTKGKCTEQNLHDGKACSTKFIANRKNQVLW